MLRFKTIFFFFSILLAIFIPLSTVSIYAKSSNLIISELNPYGSTNSSNCKLVDATNRCGFDKWLEIHNPTKESINLKDWSLQFRGSNSNADNLKFTQNIVLNPNDYYLVGYKEVNFQSTISFINLQPGGVSGKISRLSNKETGIIQVNLINPLGESVFSVNENSANYPELTNTNMKFSLEYLDNNWQIATEEFYLGNFGTPKNTVQDGLDLDNQIVEEDVIVPPTENQPKPESPTPPTTESLPIELPELTNLPKTDLAPILEKEIVAPNASQIVIEPAVTKNISIPIPESVVVSHIVKTVDLETNLENIKIQSLIQQQSTIFNNSSILTSTIASSQINNNFVKNSTSYSSSTTISTKNLWEYFFSYQAMGILAILFSISFAFFHKDSIKQSLSVNLSQMSQNSVSLIN